MPRSQGRPAPGPRHRALQSGSPDSPPSVPLSDRQFHTPKNLVSDELYERGYVTVADDGKLELSHALRPGSEALSYADAHLAGRIFDRSMTGMRRLLPLAPEALVLRGVTVSQAVGA